MKEQRKFSRIPFKSEVYLDVAGESVTGKLLDICLKGALIEESNDRFSARAGETVDMKLELADSDIELKFSCELVHREGTHLGFRFLETDVESMTHLRNLIELNLGDSGQIHEELSSLIDR